MSVEPNYRRVHDVESITSVAIEEFHEHGYERTTMAQIAERAGVTKAALYYHAAGGKEELLDRAISRGLGPLWHALQEARSRGGTPVEQLRDIVERQVEVLIEHLPEVSLFLRARGASQPERRAVERRRLFDEQVSEIVRRAMEAGEIRDDLDPSVVTRLILGAVNSMAEWYRPDGRLGAAALRDTVVTMVFDGLLVR